MNYRLHANDKGVHWICGKSYAYVEIAGRLRLRPVAADWEDTRAHH